MLQADSANTVIREATTLDLDRIAEFQFEMALETEDMRLDRETVRMGVASMYARSELGRYFVIEQRMARDDAKSAGHLIGCVLVQMEFSDWRNGFVAWIHSLYVVPHERGKGNYRDLYEWLQNHFRKEASFRGIRLYVDKRNVNAQKIYEKLGMSSEHYLMYEWMT